MSRPIVHQSIIKAPIQKVWDAITDLTTTKNGTNCPQVESDFREGGHLICMPILEARTLWCRRSICEKLMRQTNFVRPQLELPSLFRTHTAALRISNGHTQYHRHSKSTGCFHLLHCFPIAMELTAVLPSASEV